MKNSEQLTPAAAAVTALATLLCCVPTTFAAAVATTSVGLFVADYQGWFLAASVLLIAIGAWQVRSARRRCSTSAGAMVGDPARGVGGDRRHGGAVSAGAGRVHGGLARIGRRNLMRKRLVLVLLLVAIVAAFVWYLRGERRVPAGQAPLTYLRQTSLDTLRADFNAHAADVRIVVLLSPT